MPLTVIIDDADLSGLSGHAQTQLKGVIEAYATDLLSEANRIEAASRSGSLPPEISAQMVQDASSFVRKGMTAKGASRWTKILRGLAALFSLILGLIWDKESLQSGTYLIWFGLVLATTIVLVTIVSLKD